jgi:nucleotide-binding universal stress UspA family protein
MTIQRIVVGIDGSEGSARALKWAAELARPLAAEVLAVHAQHPLGYPSAESGFGFPPPMVPQAQFDAWFEAQREIVVEWCAPLIDAHVKHSILVVIGEPVAVIMEIANDQRADLIVAGRRGRGRFAEVILGSVSHHLTHHATVAVVIIPAE